MNSPLEYKIVAIPLNRDEIVSFLKPPKNIPHGTPVRILGQRPSVANEIEWAERLRDNPTIENILWRDNPHRYLTETTTDRLIPAEFIMDDPEYLTRNLGGWSPVYFALMEASDADWDSDPLLSHASVLTNYGDEIKSYGPDPTQSRERLKKEMQTDDPKTVAGAIIRLHDWRKSHHFVRSAIDMMNTADLLYTELINEGTLCEPSEDGKPAIPKALLIDELMAQLVRVENARRKFVADGNSSSAGDIADWQQKLENESGLHLMLKGEYVMGRQRRSTVLIAPELNLVAKQPGAEPFHEAKLGAVEHNGKPENWPVLTGSGAVVTPGGRMRLSIDEGLILRLNHIFGHNIRCISTLGFIIEPFVSGPTLKEYLLEKPTRLKPKLYEYVLLHQLICEALGVENGDWHAANFIVLESEPNPFASGVPKMVHIDWGAARPLEKSELAGEQKRARMNQVLNIGFSFQDAKLATDVEKIHNDLIDDPERIKSLTKKAEKIVSDAGEE